MTYESIVGRPCVPVNLSQGYWPLPWLGGIVQFEKGDDFFGFSIPRRFYGTVEGLFAKYGLWQNTKGVAKRGAISTKGGATDIVIITALLSSCVSVDPIFCGDIINGKTVLGASGAFNPGFGNGIWEINLAMTDYPLAVYDPDTNDYSTEITAIGESLKKIASSLNDFNTLLATLPLSYQCAPPGAPLVPGPSTPTILNNMSAKITDIVNEAADRSEKLSKNEVD